MGKKDAREIIKGLEESIKQAEEYLSKLKKEGGRKDNPNDFQEVSLNLMIRSNEALTLLVERTEDIKKSLGSISKAVWTMTVEISIILAIILSFIFKLITF